MKKGIVLLFFCCSFNWFSFNILSAKWFKKELATDLRSVLINQGIDLEEGAEDLIFEYKIYKKMIQDSLLDDLIKNVGLEPNEENRMIFFSAISKDLQDYIKKSFFNLNTNQPIVKNYSNGANFNGIDPNFYYQAEMTRNIYSSLASMGVKFHKSESSSKVYLVLGVIGIYLFTKFGILGKGIKLSYGYMKARENVDNVTSKIKETASSTWSKFGKFCRTMVKPFLLVDHTADHPDSAEFFKVYKFFEDLLKCDPEFLTNAKNYTEIIVNYKKGIKKRRKLYRRDVGLIHEHE